MKCPKCNETRNISTERRPDGDSYCSCGYSGKTTKFQAPPAKKYVDGVVPGQVMDVSRQAYCAVCNLVYTIGTVIEKQFCRCGKVCKIEPREPDAIVGGMKVFADPSLGPNDPTILTKDTYSPPDRLTVASQIDAALPEDPKDIEIRHLKIKLNAAEKVIEEIDAQWDQSDENSLRCRLQGALARVYKRDRQISGQKKQIVDLNVAVSRLKAIRRELRNLLKLSRKDDGNEFGYQDSK